MDDPLRGYSPPLSLLFFSPPFLSSFRRFDQSTNHHPRHILFAKMRGISFSDIFIVIFQTILLHHIHAQCPRKTASSSNAGKKDDGGGQQPPGIRPPNQFIQTTFVHRDIDDSDREYSQYFAMKLAELRPRLAQQAFLSLDNENVDCGRAGDHSEYRCREYPLQRAFHYLVIEDSRTGAAVYEFPRERNWVENAGAQTIGRLEMAILDGLSRHSAQPLVGFASKEASTELGFLRELSTAELEQQIRENHQKLMESQTKSSTASASILTRSPLELHLLNGKMLAKRKVDFPLDGAGLLQLQGPELAELIEAENVRAVFVLFWSRQSELSQHAFQIWAKTAQKWKRGMKEENIVFGAVDCQHEGEVCRAFGIFHSQENHLHHWMAFRDGHRMGQQLEIGQPQFFTEWIQILLSGPLIRLQTPTDIANAKAGILPGFEQKKMAAISIGQFRDEQQEEFRRFRRVAAMLAGRYHFAYWVEPNKDEAKLSTFRRKLTKMEEGDEEMEEQIYREGNFGIHSLLSHITLSSMPEILDIGWGFTTDLVIHPWPTLLLLHDSKQKGNDELRRNFAQIARRKYYAKKANKNRQFSMFLELDRANSLPLGEFEKKIGMKNGKQNWPAICAINLSEIRCGFGLNADGLKEEGGFANAIQKFIEIGQNNKNDEEMEEENSMEALNAHLPNRILLDLANQPHPFAQIQLEQIHVIFGRQQFQIEPIPVVELEQMKQSAATAGNDHPHHHHPHNFANIDSDSPSPISGCPMMAHLDNLRDEL